jgi:histidyl-tRNA synthetase
MERLLLASEAEGVELAPSPGVSVYVVDVTGGGEALSITDELRRAGIAADRAFDQRSMRAQLRQADRSGAAYCVIVGAEELAKGSVTLHPLRGGEEERVGRAELVRRLEERLR